MWFVPSREGGSAQGRNLWPWVVRAGPGMCSRRDQKAHPMVWSPLQSQRVRGIKFVRGTAAVKAANDEPYNCSRDGDVFMMQIKGPNSAGT